MSSITSKRKCDGAGIPASTAKSYAASFEDNRMTKEMLLDLDKEILREMNIKMMGDIIAILKHAKTVHSEEVRKKERTGSSATSERSAIKVAPLLKSTQDIIHVVPSQKRTSTALPQATTGHVTPIVVVQRPEVVDLTPSVGEDDLRHSMSSGQPQVVKKVAPVIIRPETDSYSSLHSDQALQPREPITSRIVPASRQEDHSDYVHEEYTTATYEALKTKSSRTVVLPTTTSIHRSSDDVVERSKRMLGAAGLIAASSEEKRPVTIEHKSSVFSRLGLTNESPPTQQSHSVKSRLGSRVTLTGEEEENMVVADPTSVHSRLGPRKKSEPAEVTMKKIRPTSAGVLSRPTMVADELELGEQVNIHDRLELQAAPAKRGRGSAGKRSVVFQCLY